MVERLAPAPQDMVYVSQIEAADDVLKAIEELKERGLFPNNLRAVEETDIYRLRRGLCLPSATATCINHIAGRRLIGDNNGVLTIGDIYRVMLPFHGKHLKSLEGAGLNNGWLFATPEGDLYHHTMVALAKALGLEALAINNFRSIDNFRLFIEMGNAIALSLDNNFVLNITLQESGLVVKKDGRWQIKIEDRDGVSYRNFEDGRHVVAVVGYEGGKYLVMDSFRLPQMQGDVVLRVAGVTIDQYLNYATGGDSRAIMFAENVEELRFGEEFSSVIYVPEEVVEFMKRKYLENLEKNGAVFKAVPAIF